MYRFNREDIQEILLDRYVNGVTVGEAASNVIGREITFEELQELDRQIGAQWDGWVRIRRNCRSMIPKRKGEGS